MGAGEESPEETGTQMSGGSHIEIGKGLVIEMDKALDMECQLKV